MPINKYELKETKDVYELEDLLNWSQDLEVKQFVAGNEEELWWELRDKRIVWSIKQTYIHEWLFDWTFYHFD